MEIERHLVPEMTLTEFADKHDLVMEVHERDKLSSEFVGNRFYAHFKHVETTNGRVLGGVFGNGTTEEEAIENYIPRITEQRLVVGAYSDNRKEITAPRIIGV